MAITIYIAARGHHMFTIIDDVLLSLHFSAGP
jgi:hypothetical protein